MWNVWEKGAVGNPGRYLGTITGIDELSAMRQARLVFGCECYVVLINDVRLAMQEHYVSPS